MMKTPPEPDQRSFVQGQLTPVSRFQSPQTSICWSQDVIKYDDKHTNSFKHAESLGLVLDVFLLLSHAVPLDYTQDGMIRQSYPWSIIMFRSNTSEYHLSLQLYVYNRIYKHIMYICVENREFEKTLIMLIMYMVIDLKVLVRSFNCESRACYDVANPRESFFFEFAKVTFFRESFAKVGYHDCLRKIYMEFAKVSRK